MTLPVSTRVKTRNSSYTCGDSSQLPTSIQISTNEDWTGKGTRPKTSGITQLQAVTTITSRVNTRLTAMQHMQSKQETMAAVKEIIN